MVATIIQKSNCVSNYKLSTTFVLNSTVYSRTQLVTDQSHVDVQFYFTFMLTHTYAHAYYY